MVISIDSVRLNMVNIVTFIALLFAATLASVAVTLPNAFCKIVPTWATIINRADCDPKRMIRATEMQCFALARAKDMFGGIAPLAIEELAAMFASFILSLSRVNPASISAIQAVRPCGLEQASALKAGSRGFKAERLFWIVQTGIPLAFLRAILLHVTQMPFDRKSGAAILATQICWRLTANRSAISATLNSANLARLNGKIVSAYAASLDNTYSLSGVYNYALLFHAPIIHQGDAYAKSTG